MQLSTFTDYSLRVLISVGSRKDQQLSTIQEIAKHHAISRNHLIKVVHHLSHSGYLSTMRGKGGGIKLAKPASEIRVGDVIRDTEYRFDLAPCFNNDKKGSCAIEPACALKRALQQALQAFLSVTDGYTLADLIRPRHRLRTLLWRES